MKAEGLAANPSNRQWRISVSSGQIGSPPHPEPAPALTEEVSRDAHLIEPTAEMVLGMGPESVYVYFYETYRQCAVANEATRWPCKVGRCNGDPAPRVFSQAATALPEFPTVALLLPDSLPNESESFVGRSAQRSKRHKAIAEASELRHRTSSLSNGQILLKFQEQVDAAIAEPDDRPNN